MVPLQSLSSPSQISVFGPVEPLHCLTPLWHTVRPALHWPMQFATWPPGQLLPHAAPTSVRLSATVPLQSSSWPPQISAVGPPLPLHCWTPLGHTVGPALHSPMQFATCPPGQRVPHATLTPAGLLSTTPLQSSSMPLQVSA